MQLRKNEFVVMMQSLQSSEEREVRKSYLEEVKKSNKQQDEAIIICYGIPAFVIAIIVISFIATYFKKPDKENLQKTEMEKRKKALADTERGFYHSLDKLKSDPTNVILKQFTIFQGRRYAELTRQVRSFDESISICDEMTLMNDINAACRRRN